MFETSKGSELLEVELTAEEHKAYIRIVYETPTQKKQVLDIPVDWDMLRARDGDSGSVLVLSTPIRVNDAILSGLRKSTGG